VKTYVVLFLAALSGAVGETFFSYGMRRFGAMDWTSPRRWLDLLFVVARNPYVLTGVFFAAGFFFLYLTALSWVDLSFAMPLTALSFLFATLFARFALKEDVSWYRWAGTLIIVAGISLVALDRKPRTLLAPAAGAVPVPAAGEVNTGE
jgi:drug/metabolite transporter (DMT)-like permease